MKQMMLFALAVTLLAGCGVKRPLIAPKDIPAYEAKQQKKRERLMQEEQTATQPPAATGASQ